jgi:ubiquinone/menaquinone biosynthesis C-methylase UbiE
MLSGHEGAWWRLVRWGFHLLYNQMAFTYDVVSKVVSLGAWRCWQRAALKHIGTPADCPRVLEVAHGTGDLQSDLKRAGYHTVGYDLSASMGRIACRKLHRQGLTPLLTRGFAQALPFPADHFDAVVTTFPSEFIIDPLTLREVWRVLKADGRMVIVPGALFTARGLPQRVLDWLYRITGQRETGPEADTRLRETLELIERHGFDVIAHWEDCPGSRVMVISARKRSGFMD